MLGGSVHTIGKNTETLVVSRKGNEIELYADKASYVFK